MSGQSSTGSLEETSAVRATAASHTLSLARVVGTLQVVLATRRAARLAEHARTQPR